MLQHLTSDVIFSRGVKPLNAPTLIRTGIPDSGAVKGRQPSTTSAELTIYITAANTEIGVFFVFFCAFDVTTSISR